MEWNGERETMSEAVEKYAKEYALKQHVKIVKNLMETTGFTPFCIGKEVDRMKMVI